MGYKKYVTASASTARTFHYVHAQVHSRAHASTRPPWCAAVFPHWDGAAASLGCATSRFGPHAHEGGPRWRTECRGGTAVHRDDAAATSVHATMRQGARRRTRELTPPHAPVCALTPGNTVRGRFEVLTDFQNLSELFAKRGLRFCPNFARDLRSRLENLSELSKKSEKNSKKSSITKRSHSGGSMVGIEWSVKWVKRETEPSAACRSGVRRRAEIADARVQAPPKLSLSPSADVRTLDRPPGPTLPDVRTFDLP
ncbi:hypothetical protein GGX14DRAFT_408819 [Mycena pura]|uniref:Uncharacterized protein n=1 Tax=Mycena pura TaxID=153505 RepID=A0AAD6UKY8_9AGAR|nr:hypothetical protein GGX14DRAFT_408819 [Mycena pura]